MFETTRTIITNDTRNLISKMKESPFLYTMFVAMIVFSTIIFAFATYFLINIETNLEIELKDIFYLVIFCFFLKSSVDFFKHFIKANNITYTLSTEVKHWKTILEIFIAILVMNLIIWFSFSSLFLIFISAFNINAFYPVEYLIFTTGIIIANCIGISLCINFFSPKRYRMIPTVILLGFYLYYREPLFVTLTFPLVVIHIFWAISIAEESHQFIRRKKRIKEKSQIKIRSVINAFFQRETTILWRDKLFFSFIFSSAAGGFGAGYLYLYGDKLFIPEAVRELYSGFLPAMFVFLGIFAVIMYTAVFPALNLFLNEEKTMWIIRHIPVKNDVIIYGKASALLLCFITTIPFIAFISIFMGVERIVFITWFLIFSYIAGVIISIPIGVKYVGKKSDIMLLYSVSMVLFVILGFSATLGSLIENQFNYHLLIYFFLILVELLILFFSLKLSSWILRLKYA